MEWVERCGPWSFDNNLLLLYRWKKGLTSTNISFTHSPFWVQIWGLPFEHMSQDVGEEIGSKLGKFIEVDRHSWQSGQAKFMRVCVELEIDKPLRRGAYIASSEDEQLWLTFKYERLPIVCFIYGKLGHDKKHCPTAGDWQTACHQYGDWLRVRWIAKTAAKEKNPSKEMSRMNSGELVAQQMTEPATGSASACLEASSPVGGKRSMEKSDTWGIDDSTCADGQLAGDVQAFRGPTEQLMSAAIGQMKCVALGQDLGALGSCDQLRQVFSTEYIDSFSHGPKSLASQSPKGSFVQGSPSTKASLETNEKDNPVMKNLANAVQVGVIFQAKAHGKGKQIWGKGNLKKVARAKGKVSDDQTLTQMLKFGAKHLRVTKASKEENNRAPKRLCEPINLGLADAV